MCALNYEKQIVTTAFALWEALLYQRISEYRFTMCKKIKK